jgi:hypothetical protein
LWGTNQYLNDIMLTGDRSVYNVVSALFWGAFLKKARQKTQICSRFRVFLGSFFKKKTVFSKKSSLKRMLHIIHRWAPPEIRHYVSLMI